MNNKVLLLLTLIISISYGRRYYDPVMGMWITPDPKEQFWSPYAYAGNGMNPMNAVDPNGETLIGDGLTALTTYPGKTLGVAYFAVEGRTIAAGYRQELIAGGMNPTIAEGRENAFRHAFFAITLLKGYGINDAVKFLKNHEIMSPDQVDSRIDIVNNIRSLEWALTQNLDELVPFDAAKLLVENNMLINSEADFNAQVSDPSSITINKMDEITK